MDPELVEALENEQRLSELCRAIEKHVLQAKEAKSTRVASSPSSSSSVQETLQTIRQLYNDQAKIKSALPGFARKLPALGRKELAPLIKFIVDEPDFAVRQLLLPHTLGPVATAPSAAAVFVQSPGLFTALALGVRYCEASAEVLKITDMTEEDTPPVEIYVDGALELLENCVTALLHTEVRYNLLAS